MMSEPENIGCEQALQRLLEFLDRELPEVEHDQVDRHLRTCRSCFSRMEFENRLKGQLAMLSGADLPAGARDRIRKLIQGF